MHHDAATRAPFGRGGNRLQAYWALVLPILIALLLLADGVLHLRLDYIIFDGTLWGTASPGGGGPTPGAPPPGPGGPPPDGGGGNPLPLPLNELFSLNFLAAIALLIAFLVAYRWFRCWLWLVDAAILGFSAFSIYGWWKVGEPNPQGLGYISKGLEVALILLVVAHAWLVLNHRRSDGPAEAGSS